MMSRRSKSPSNSQSLAKNKSIKFCHYRNGMYMGQMRCFERQGNGIVILDTGEVAIATYKKDKLQGNTVIFTKNNQFYSILFDHNNLLEIVAKDHDKLLYVKFKHSLPEGQATVIDFASQQIFYLTYKQGKIIEKTYEQDSVLINHIFSHSNLSTLIPISHLKSLDFEFKVPFLQVLKRNSTITVGFHKQGLMNGLGFILYKDLDKQKSFYSLLEKGYYKDSQLCGLGQKRYQNGNLYIGEFNQNLFNGKGLLFNSVKSNWVKGLFRDGNMIDMVQYSNEGDTKDPKITEMLAAIHKKKSSWINSDIKFCSQIHFDTFFHQLIQDATNYKEDLVLDYQQKKQLVLKRIQENFVPSNNILSPYKQSFSPKSNILKTHQNTSDKKKINSFENIRDKSTSMIKLSPVTKQQKRRNLVFKSSFSKTPERKQLSFSKKKSQNYNKLQSPNQNQQSSRQNWKSKTDQTPLNIYTFEQSQPIKHNYSQNEEKQDLSPQKKFNFSVNRVQQTPLESQISKRSISGSRRNKIFGESPSRMINSSRIGQFPSPSKSSIKEVNGNIGDSSVSDVFNDIGRFNNINSKRSRKMIRSRIFQQDEVKQQEHLPTFRYSRFQTQEDRLGSSFKKSRIF